ncbi:serine O-acetyltransferase [Gordonia prachuapensis]|uniref:serine O-acetyltransferase n=1 Tax=Gordonia prachuapensis TaxID=3115651 RepID=UPI003D669E73
MLEAIFCDWQRNAINGRSSGLSSRLADIGTVRFVAVVLFRVSQALGRRWGPLGSAVKQINTVITGCDISWQADIAPGLVLYHPVGVVIGPNVWIGNDVTIQQGVTIGSRSPADVSGPVIGAGCQLGAGSRVLGDVVLGNQCTIGANAVVLKSLPDSVSAVGIPASIVGFSMNVSEDGEC